METTEFPYRIRHIGLWRYNMINAFDPCRRYRNALGAIDEARRLFPPLPSDLSTDDYMAMMRDPVPDPLKESGRK